MSELLLNSGWLRRIVWRAGRYLYCRARGETANEISTNGEAYVQECVLNGSRSSDQPLVMFDIGANVGDWTLSLLRQLPQSRRLNARVLLFEPISATCMKLRENLAGKEGIEITQIFPLAMSNNVGASKMAVFSDTGGTDTLEFDMRMGTKAKEFVLVEKSTIDNFCANKSIAHIHLLKCDTEGHDAHILKGALKLLNASRIDVAQFEYNHCWIYSRTFLRDVFDLVERLPYRVARVCPRHIELLESWHPELERFFEGNYLLVHESALAWFNARRGTFDVSNTYA